MFLFVIFFVHYLSGEKVYTRRWYPASFFFTCNFSLRDFNYRVKTALAHENK